MLVLMFSRTSFIFIVVSKCLNFCAFPEAVVPVLFS